MSGDQELREKVKSSTEEKWKSYDYSRKHLMREIKDEDKKTESSAKKE